MGTKVKLRIFIVIAFGMVVGCGLYKTHDRVIEDTFIDPRDGYTYRIITIRGMTWMADNLNYESANSWCFGDRDSTCDTYGRLYTWNAAMAACPTGWRLSTDRDWLKLEKAVGASVAAQKLRSSEGWFKLIASRVDTTIFATDNSGTDDFGFSALPGGVRLTDGRFHSIGLTGSWWTAMTKDDIGPYNAYMLSKGTGYIGYHENRTDDEKGHGLSVRCVKLKN